MEKTETRKPILIDLNNIQKYGRTAKCVYLGERIDDLKPGDTVEIYEIPEGGCFIPEKGYFIKKQEN